VRRRRRAKCLAESVELELLVHPVADLVGAPGVAGQVSEAALVGDRAAVDPVSRLQLRAVGQNTLGNKRHRVVEERVGLNDCHCLAGVALVADPGVAVVVVASRLCALGQAHGGRSDHAPTGAGETSQHCVGVAGVTGGHGVCKLRDGPGPCGFRRLPHERGGHRRTDEGVLADLENQVVVSPVVDLYLGHERSVFDGLCSVRSRPTEVEATAAGGPRALMLAHIGHGTPTEVGAGVEDDADPGGAIQRGDPAQDDRGAGVGRERQGLAALDDPGAGHPAAVPDEAAALVVPAPHEAGISGRDRVHASAADQGGEQGVGVPTWSAHPHEVALRTDQDAALAIGQ